MGIKKWFQLRTDFQLPDWSEWYTSELICLFIDAGMFFSYSCALQNNDVELVSTLLEAYNKN